MASSPGGRRKFIRSRGRVDSLRFRVGRVRLRKRTRCLLLPLRRPWQRSRRRRRSLVLATAAPVATKASPRVAASVRQALRPHVQRHTPRMRPLRHQHPSSIQERPMTVKSISAIVRRNLRFDDDDDARGAGAKRSVRRSGRAIQAGTRRARGEGLRDRFVRSSPRVSS